METLPLQTGQSFVLTGLTAHSGLGFSRPDTPFMNFPNCLNSLSFVSRQQCFSPEFSYSGVCEATDLGSQNF